MRAWLLVVVVVFCGCEPQAPASSTRGCALSGHYRLRFEANVGQRLWFRFQVNKAVTAAELTPPIAISATERALKLDPDPAACKLTVIAQTKRGELLASLTLDSKTHAVTGTLRGVGMREGVRIHGVRDVGAQTSKHACITPGVYKLVVPAEQAWTSPDHRSCDGASLKVPFLVEYVGDQLALDQLDAKGDAAWTAEDIYQHEDAPCIVDVRFRHHEWSSTARLEFATATATATATHASVQVSEDGNVWRCEIDKPMVWIER